MAGVIRKCYIVSKFSHVICYWIMVCASLVVTMYIVWWGKKYVNNTIYFHFEQYAWHLKCYSWMILIYAIFVFNTVAKLLYMLSSLLQSNYKLLGKMHLVSVVQLEHRNRKKTLTPNSEETIAFVQLRSFQNTSKFQEQTWDSQDSQWNPLSA